MKKHTLTQTATLVCTLLALSATAQDWRVSAGLGARMGMKIEGKGGTFDMKPTGFVRANPSDPASLKDPDNPQTTIWGVDNPTVYDPGTNPGGQFHTPDGTHIGIAFEDLYYLSFERAKGSSDASATMPGFEIAVARDLMIEDSYMLGARFTLGGNFGLSESISARAQRETHAFAELTDPTTPGSHYVELNPWTTESGESTKLTAKGSMWKFGLGPEVTLVDEEYTGIGLVLHPYLSLNMVSMSVDGTQRDAAGVEVARISESKSELLFGGGISATVTYDIDDRLGVGLSVGYEFLPKMDVSGSGGLGAEIAFSALTLGANVTWKF